MYSRTIGRVTFRTMMKAYTSMKAYTMMKACTMSKASMAKTSMVKIPMMSALPLSYPTPKVKVAKATVMAASKGDGRRRPTMNSLNFSSDHYSRAHAIPFVEQWLCTLVSTPCTSQPGAGPKVIGQFTVRRCRRGTVCRP